jgi:hypothetical protein
MCSPRCGNLWLEPRSGQTKDYKIGIFYFLADPAARGKDKRLADSQSRQSVRVWQHINPRTVVAVSQHYVNSTKRTL